MLQSQTYKLYYPPSLNKIIAEKQSSIEEIGFVIPEEFSNKNSSCGSNSVSYDSNTFYVVFLDREHRFYKTEQK